MSFINKQFSCYEVTVLKWIILRQVMHIWDYSEGIYVRYDMKMK